MTLWAGSFTADQDDLATVVAGTGAFFGASGALQHQQKTTQRLLAELFRQGQHSGEARTDHDPHQLAEVLTATMLPTTINWLGNWHHDTGQPLRERLHRASTSSSTARCDPGNGPRRTTQSACHPLGVRHSHHPR